EATKSLDHDKLAAYIHAHKFSTVAGEIAFGKDGEWTKSRQFFTQFQRVSGNDLAQFRDTTHQVILWPPEYKTGNIIYPSKDAKKKEDLGRPGYGRSVHEFGRGPPGHRSWLREAVSRASNPSAAKHCSAWPLISRSIPMLISREPKPDRLVRLGAGPRL